MSESEEHNVVRFVRRQVERHVPTLGKCVLSAPSVAVDMRLAHYFSAHEADARAFVNELLAAVVETPELDAASVDALSERGRAIMRVAAVEACGCSRAYRRLAGSGLSGDERFFQAMRVRHEDNLAHLRDALGAMNDNVVRMVERAQKTLLDTGALAFVQRNQRHLERIAETYTRAIKPAHLEQIERINRQVERAIKPAVLDHLARPDSALNMVTRGYVRMAEDVSRQLQSALRPTYFGDLDRISKQINEAIRPAHLAALTRVSEQIREVIRPQYFDSLVRISEQIERAIKPAYLAQVTALSERLRAFARTPLLEALRDNLLSALEAYSTFLERRYPGVFANPDKPPPFLFVVATLPLWVAVPLLDALVEGDDEPLLERVEEAIEGTAIVNLVQAALRQSSLDEIAKRHLLEALDHVRAQRYVSAEPHLYQGLERAFRDTASRRGIIDPEKEFLIGSGRRARARVEEFLGHMIEDPRYLRFLRSWVFGPLGDAARHGGLRGEEAYRRWVLRGFLAVVGWLEYCASDEEPMKALKAQLELGCRSEEAEEHTA